MMPCDVSPVAMFCLGGGKYEGPVGAGDQEVNFLFFAPSQGIHSDSGKKD